MSLEKLIKPKSIAIVGVSEKPGFGRNTAMSALKSKNTDRIYFVNPNRDNLFGKECYESITKLPEVVDCVVLCTSKNTIPGILEEAGTFGIKSAIVFASGFSEEGSNEGIQLENEIIEISNKYNIKVLGPNCMGAINNVDKINLWAGHTHWDLDDNNHGIAIIAQSGFIAAEILNTDFINVTYGISSGNGSVVALEEFLEFMIEDESVSVIALYLEGIKDATRFTRALKMAAEIRKPVIVLKSGRSIKGAISAASHTGSLAGSHKSYQSVFEKYGVITAETLDEFMCLAQTLSVLKGNFAEKTTYAAISFSGGESTLIADIAEENDIELAELFEETKIEMKKYLPEFATPKNPLDATTALFRDEEKIVGLLKTLNNDINVGSIIVGANVKREKDDTTSLLCKSIARAKNEGVTKPILAVPSLEGYRYRESRRILEDAGVPLMSSVGIALSCINKLSRFVEYDYKKNVLKIAAHRKNIEKEAIALSEFDSKKELEKNGVPIPVQAIVNNIEELTVVINEIKYPLVLKINSSEILHKSDVGGVKININNKEEAVIAFNEILENVRKNAPTAQSDGILVQQMAPFGVEIIIGVSNDKQFGPMLLVGLGGVFVEVFKDAVISPVPINKDEAFRMLKKLKSFKLLNGYRGSEACDIDSLTDLMVNISEYAYKNSEVLKEMDLNPVFVYPEGKGVCAVDALIVKYID